MHHMFKRKYSALQTIGQHLTWTKALDKPQGVAQVRYYDKFVHTELT